MKIKYPLNVYGAILILVGIFLLFSTHFSFQTIKLTLSITLIFGALLAFAKTLSRRKKLIEVSYYELHGTSMFVYSLLLLLFVNTELSLIYVSISLMFFYAFSEIIFCNSLFNNGKSVVYKIIILRIFLAFIVGFITSLIIYFNDEPNNKSIEIFGILFIIIGTNVLLHIPVIKQRESAEDFNSQN